jgi:hypothetical protein
MLKAPRPLAPQEVDALLASDVPLHLATLDGAGFPHVTPLWFVWSDDAFYMTSIVDRPHCQRLERDGRAGIGIDIEAPERPDGQRPNRQIRAVGMAELFPETDGVWTRAITAKYVRGPAAEAQRELRAADRRFVIRLKPARVIGVASI